MERLQRRLWKTRTWLDGRRIMESGYGPGEEKKQLQALHLIFNEEQVWMTDRRKQQRIRKIRDHALTPTIASVAQQMEDEIKRKQDKQPPVPAEKV